MPYFTIFKYNDNLYQIRDSISVLSTLVIGKNKAILFDTCYGIGDLKQEINKITKKPLIVINSHSHMDHTSGNYQFPIVYINKEDYNDCLSYNNISWRIKNIKRAEKLNAIPDNFNKEQYLENRTPVYKFLDDGEIFDLGDLNVEVIGLPGHTRGSIGLLIKEQRILLSSDALGPYVWLFLRESTTVSEYIQMCKRIYSLEFDKFLGGHIPQLMEKSDILKFIDVAKKIDIDKSEKVVYEDFEDLNSYAFSINGKIYSPNSIGLLFDPNKL